MATPRASPARGPVEAVSPRVDRSRDGDAIPLLPLEPRAEQEQATASGEEPTFGQRAAALLSRTLFWRSPDSVPPAEPSAASSGPAAVPVVPERASSGAGATDLEGGGEIEGAAAPEPPARANSQPVCLICLETLAPDDFASGRAISLGCGCRGDLALRHRDCAQKWAQVKDDGRGGVPVCELCKRPTKLAALPPRPHLLRPEPAAAAAAAALQEELYADQMTFAQFAPSTADLVFDCIRVTWVAMIVSILFFEASLGSALWTGVVAGLAYAIMVRLMYRSHFEAMRAAYAEQRRAAAGPPGAAAAPPQVAANVV